jgi:hypothetical protein
VSDCTKTSERHATQPRYRRSGGTPGHSGPGAASGQDGRSGDRGGDRDDDRDDDRDGDRHATRSHQPPVDGVGPVGGIGGAGDALGGTPSQRLLVQTELDQDIGGIAHRRQAVLQEPVGARGCRAPDRAGDGHHRPVALERLVHRDE